MMDPVSLGLGAASLAIQVFDGAVKGYEYFAVAANMPERYESLRLRLRIEYGRLLDWGEAAGIIESPEAFDKKMKVNGGTVMALLSEMRSLLKKMRTYSLRYDGVAGPLPDTDSGQPRIQPIDTVNMNEYRAIFESKDIPKDKRKYPRGLNRLVELAGGGMDIAKHPKRFRWAAIDEKLFKEDLDRMAWLTNFLHETLGDHQTKILMQTTRETYLAVLQLTKDIQQMKMVAEVAPEPTTADTEGEDTASIFSQAETLVEGRLSSPYNRLSASGGDRAHRMTIFEQLAIFRAVNASLYSQNKAISLSVPKIDQINDLTDMKQLEGSHRMTAVYHGKNVWVEWKSYQRDDEIVTPNDIVYKLSKKVRQDAERLVGLLRAKEKPAEFCVPDCAGYIDDAGNDRFGFVYQVRDTVLSTFQPTSLLQMLNGEPPSLKARVGLAQQLATCLLYLHATNWLHKALRSASILFFNDAEVPNIQRPYISSFEYSRPDKNDATFTGAPEKSEWAVYCHPDYLGRPGYFRKSYDIYSLGIILLEIAYWTPAEKIFEIESKESDQLVRAQDVQQLAQPQNDERLNTDGYDYLESPPEGAMEKRNRKIAGIKNWLLLDESHGGRTKYLEHVRNTMGERYHNAVKACLGGLDHFHLPKEANQTDPIIATLLQQAYLRLVVDVLHTIAV